MIGSLPSGWVIEIVWLPSGFVTTLTSGAKPSFPLSPLSPLAPLMFPACCHVPSFLTSTSPVVVLMNVSPSFPSWAVGVPVPFRISFPSRPFCPFVPFCPGKPWVPSWPRSPLSPFGPLMLPSFSHVPLFLTKMSPVSVLTYLSPLLPWLASGFALPFKTSFPSRPAAPASPFAPATPVSPLSPFGPLILPSFSHVPLFLTKISPVSVLTYLSPSLPWLASGFTLPFKTSFPSRPAAPASPLSPFAPVAPSWPSLMIDVPRTVSVSASNWLFTFLSL